MIKNRVGEGWNRPMWRHALVWLIWRPYYWLKGQYYDKTIKFADKHGNFGPFKRIQWVGKGGIENSPYTDYYQITEVHHPYQKCKCDKEYRGTLHHLIWLPSTDYTWVGDEWYKKSKRYYKF